MSELRKALAESQVEEEVPDGFKTAAEWAYMEKFSLSHTARILRQLVNSGQMDLQFFRVRVGSMIRPTPHYRLSTK